ncbi:hypothetical protein [Glycomyces sp. NPDC047010]|uniref:hypothetical protein n=1 Tax=Glycomyces sp. NPDC047010 TaxID=3155023 RepID=UPI0034025F6B
MTARQHRLPAGPTPATLTSRGGRPESEPRAAAVPLGSVEVDGRRIELVWLTLTDSVLVDFADIEPKRIGTIVTGPYGPRFIAQPGHLDWLAYEERENRVLRAAVLCRAERTLPGPRLRTY